MARFVSIIYMKVNHYSRNIAGQPLDSVHTLLATYSVQPLRTSFLTAPSKRTGQVLQTAEHGLDTEEMCFDSWQE